MSAAATSSVRPAPSGDLSAMRDDGAPIRVAILTPGYGPSHGILGRHVQALANATALAGGEVEVLVHAPPYAKVAPAPHGLSVTRFPPLIPRSESALSRALWGYLRRHGGDFDILHAHGEASLPALLAVRDAAPHVIFTPHWYASAQRHLRHLAQGRVYRFDKRVLDSADRVLCVSRSEALQVARHAPTASLDVVPNGFDIEAIAGAQPFDIDGEVILSVDRLTRWAGIHRVASALLTLPKRCKLVIAGRGQGRSGLEAHVDYLRLSDRVKFVGAVSDDDLHRWMRTASVLATLKEESLWGGTMLTAACAGTPVLASDISANREAAEMLDPKQVAFASRRASPFAIAEAIEHLTEGADRFSAPSVPTWQLAAQRTILIYKSVLRDGD